VKIENVVSELGSDWTVLEAQPEESDGFPPVASLIVHTGTVAAPSPDRLAAAGSIAFHPWISGAVRCGREVSPLTAQRISRSFEPAWTSVEPVMRRAFPLPRGRAEVTISAVAARSSEAPVLRFAPVSRGAATRFGPGVVDVPSNAALLEALSPPGSDCRGAAILAAATLLAEPAGVASYVLDESLVSQRVASRFQPLLEAVGLAISWRAAPATAAAS